MPLGDLCPKLPGLIAARNTYGASASDRLFSQKGAVFNGTTDDSAAIQAALNTLKSSNRSGLTFPPGGLSTNIGTGLIITSALGPIDFNNLTLMSSVTSGPAISIIANPNAPFSKYCPLSPISNFYLQGPDVDNTAVDGIVVASSGGPIAAQLFENFVVDGFRDNLAFGNNTYIVHLRCFQSTNAHRRGVSFVGGTTAGEGMTLSNGVIADCQNATGNAAVGLYVDPNANAPDVFCFGVDHDYSNIAFDIGAGKTQLTANHFENSSNSPMGNLSCTAAGSGGNGFPTHVHIVGGSARHGGISQPNPEPASGRPVYFQVTDTTGVNQLAFTVEGLQYKNNGRYATEFCNVNVAGSNPACRITLAWEQRNGTNGRVSGYTNNLFNGTFETGSPPTGWTTTGSTTFTQDTSVFRSGTASGKIVNTGGSGNIQSTNIPCRPGERILQRGYINLSAFVAGTVRPKVYFYDSAGDAIANSSGSPSFTAVTSGWVQADMVYSVPAQTAYARCGIEWLSFNGTFNADDWECWVI